MSRSSKQLAGNSWKRLDRIWMSGQWGEYPLELTATHSPLNISRRILEKNLHEYAFFLYSFIGVC